MGIAFDEGGELYATTFATQTALFRIDLTTGRANLVGSTGVAFVHSAEFAAVR